MTTHKHDWVIPEPAPPSDDPALYQSDECARGACDDCDSWRQLVASVTNRGDVSVCSCPHHALDSRHSYLIKNPVRIGDLKAIWPIDGTRPCTAIVFVSGVSHGDDDAFTDSVLYNLDAATATAAKRAWLGSPADREYTIDPATGALEIALSISGDPEPNITTEYRIRVTPVEMRDAEGKPIK